AVAVFAIRARADHTGWGRTPVVGVPEAQVMPVLVSGHPNAGGFQPATFRSDIRLSAKVARSSGIADRVEVVLARVIPGGLGHLTRMRQDLDVRAFALIP